MLSVTMHLAASASTGRRRSAVLLSGEGFTARSLRLEPRLPEQQSGRCEGPSPSVSAEARANEQADADADASTAMAAGSHYKQRPTQRHTPARNIASRALYEYRARAACCPRFPSPPVRALPAVRAIFAATASTALCICICIFPRPCRVLARCVFCNSPYTSAALRARLYSF
ncbi:hypothetical protein P171DRAFT_206028 [Karstenula rhodostoma CBS 690.94]|uniref:Uncharacterized protein n=1 Tax=Karstenula rhodostoma CBS 690.94 TaxID=1392251 RepID=A0A9P4PMZ6_9PLEO|nr:hypothetical protein P171DRAFT_206028 [Karstenula rhodostoma CBS 690.94]